MTKILKTLCVTIVVIISTIFLPVRIFMAIILGIKSIFHEYSTKSQWE